MFSQFYITDIGRTYLAKAVAGQKLVFTKGVAGSGLLSGGTTPQTATEMVTTQFNMPVSTAKTSADKTTVTCQFTNLQGGSIKPEFRWTEAGLFAKIDQDATAPEALYAYATSGTLEAGDVIPATLTEFAFNWILTTGAATNIIADVNSSLVYVTASGDASNTTIAFTQAASRTAIATGESQATLFGKIMKWLADLKTVAFSGSYADLINKPASFAPSMHASTHASGAADQIYPADIGAEATGTAASAVSTHNASASAHTTLFSGVNARIDGIHTHANKSVIDLVAQTTLDDVAAAKTHGTLTTNPHSVTKAQVGLGNVDNTSDAAKPISTATQTALNGKAPTVHTHAYVSTSSYTAADVLTKIKTVDGTTSGLDADLLDGLEATAFATAAHAHTIANVTNLQTELDGKAPTAHAHSTFDRATSVLTGANVFSDIVVTDGITTALTTRALTPANIGAATAAQGTKADNALPLDSYTAADILTKIKTVDGTGTGLDADLLDGLQATAFATAAQGTKADNLSSGTVAAGNALKLGGQLPAYYAPQSTTYTKTEVDNSIAAVVTAMDWKESVANLAAIATTYPTPADGWTVNVNDTDITYRYNGTDWIAISSNSIPKATTSVDGLMSKEQVAVLEGALQKAGDTMSGDLNMGTKKIWNLANPTEGDHAANKTYVDTEVATRALSSHTHEYVSTASYTASDVLTKIKTVDGAGSGLDADTLDGLNAATAATASTIAARDASGYISAAGFNSTLADTATAASHYLVETGSDGLMRPKTLANVKAEIVTKAQVEAVLTGAITTHTHAYVSASSYTAADVLTKIKTVDGAGSGLDADLLDGIGSDGFVRYGSNQSLGQWPQIIGGYVGGDSYLQFMNNSGTRMAFVGYGSVGAPFSITDVANAGINFSSASGVVQINGQTIWHSGIDGAGSGLDADLLDGQHASAFATTDMLRTTPFTRIGTPETSLDTYSSGFPSPCTYKIVWSNSTTNYIALGGQTWLIEGFVHHASWETQVATSYLDAAGAIIMSRNKFNGVWKPWGCVAPQLSGATVPASLYPGQVFVKI